MLADTHLELNPDDARAWYLSAAARMRLGQTDQAVERGRRAFAIDPKDAGVLYNLACNYALGGVERRGDRIFEESDPEWIRTAGMAGERFSLGFDTRRSAISGPATKTLTSINLSTFQVALRGIQLR